MSISAKTPFTAKTLIRVLLATIGSALLCPALAADKPSEEHAVSVSFVTNRALKADGSGPDLYGNDLGPLSAGRCVVDVAAKSGRGALTDAVNSDVDSLLEALEASRDAGLIVYVHGYYEDFERSCRRAAVLKHSLNLPRGFLLFSWPANSNPITYAADVEDMEASTPQFRAFLQELATRIGAGRISVVGHSLGTRGLVKALKTSPEPTHSYRDLVLIASDMETEQFVEALPLLSQRAENITLLVSDRDLALRVSRTINGAPRLGQVNEGAFEGVTVIDVTDVANTHLSGHVYHLRNERVIADLRRVLKP